MISWVWDLGSLLSGRFLVSLLWMVLTPSDPDRHLFNGRPKSSDYGLGLLALSRPPLFLFLFFPSTAFLQRVMDNHDKAHDRHESGSYFST